MSTLSKGEEALCPPLETLPSRNIPVDCFCERRPKSLISRWGDASEARVYIRAILGGGWTSPLLHIRHPLKSNGARHIYLSKGEEKNLLANEMSLQILGGGQLYAFHQSRYTPSPLGLCRTKTFRWIVFVRGRGRGEGNLVILLNPALTPHPYLLPKGRRNISVALAPWGEGRIS